MTMADMKCDVCEIRLAIGVASTSIPYSCAFCFECARASADPEWIFYWFLEDIGRPSLVREGLVTWSNGKFISFHDWAKEIVCELPNAN